MAGGFGGLGGTIQALGLALLASPRGSPFSALPEIMASVEKSSQSERSRSAMARALEKMGLDPSYADSPEAAGMLLQHQKEQAAASQIPGLNAAIAEGLRETY